MHPSVHFSQRATKRLHARLRRGSAVVWLLAAVATAVLACGTVDSRKLQDVGKGSGGSGGAHSASGTGGKSNASGGAKSGGSGGTSPGGSDGFEEGGIGDTGGNGPATCGNGIAEGNEECDDGNVQSGDGCDAECRKEKCGNGRVDTGEQCDPPSADTCSD